MATDLGLAYLAPIEAQQKMDQAAALAPATLAHTLAMTRLGNAEAGAKEADAAAEGRVAASMSQMFGGGTPGTGGQGSATSGTSPAMPSAAEMLTRFGQAYAVAGSPAKSAKMLEQAQLAMSREAAAGARNASEELTRLKSEQLKAATITQLSGGVTNQETWDAANARYAQLTGEASPFAGKPYDPRLIQFLQESSVTMAKKAKLGMEEVEMRDRMAKRAADISMAGARLANDSAKTDAYVARQTAVRKDAGKDVGAPTRMEQDASYSIVKSAYPDLPTEQAKLAAFSIASRARALRRGNPGLDADTATRKALADSTKDGDFPTSKTWYGGTTTSFERNDGSVAPPKNVLPLPPDRKVETGKVYLTPRGPAKWNGKAFVPVTSSKPSMPAALDPEADGMDDDGGDNE